MRSSQNPDQFKPAIRSFWEAFFAGVESDEIKARAVLEKSLPSDYLAAEAGSLMGLWMQAKAVHRWEEENARSRKAGFATGPRRTPWEWSSLEPGEQPEAMVLMARAFLAAGADPTAPLRGWPTSALELAARLGWSKVFAECLGCPKAPSVHALSTAMLGDLDRAENPQTGATESRHWIHWAAGQKDPAFVRALVDHGVSPELPDERGRTPVFFARSLPAVRQLLEAGASLEATDHRGMSVLAYWATSGSVSWGKEALDGLPWQVSALAVLRAPPVGDLPSRRWAMQAVRSTTEDMEAALAKGKQVFHRLRVEDGGVWSGSWPLAAFWGRLALRESTPGNKSASTLLSLAPRHRWLPAHATCSAPGMPDRGWVALGLWCGGGSLDKGLDWEKSGQGLGLSERWWEDPGVLEDALEVSKKLVSRRTHLAGVSAAWATWLNKATQEAIDSRECLPEKAPVILLENVKRLVKARIPVATSAWVAAFEHLAATVKMDDHRVDLIPVMLDLDPVPPSLINLLWPTDWTWPTEASTAFLLRNEGFALPRLGAPRLAQLRAAALSLGLSTEEPAVPKVSRSKRF